MIHIKKQSKAKLLLILTAVMAVLVAGYFVLVALLPEGGEEPKQPYEQLEWEGKGQRVFPDVDTSDVQYITVNATEGSEYASYGLIKSEDGTFSLWYQPEKGVEEYLEYRPDIISADPSFTYSSLYAMDSFGQGQVARFFYLRSAITTMYFTERISLEGLSEDALRSYYEEFGFMDYGDYSDSTDNKKLGVIVNYGDGSVDEDGKNLDTHVIWVGGKNVSENGYYVILDNHPYIYATNNSTIGYATQPYTYYISPSVISAGLAVDAAYEPYLIHDYQQWVNTFESNAGSAIVDNAEVIVKGETFLPKDPVLGGLISREESTAFDLLKLKESSSAYQRLIRILTMQRLSGILNPDTEEEEMPLLPSPLYITVPADALSVSYSAGKSALVYRYHIVSIDSALTEDGEVADVGEAIPQNATALRVSYDLYIDGAAQKSNEERLYAVLPLSDNRIGAKKSEILESRIGEVNIDLQISYDIAEFTANHIRTVKIYVADILAIYDKDGKSASTVKEDSLVVYRYYMEINGIKQEVYKTAADKVSAMDDSNAALFLALGKVGTGYNKQIGEYKEYLQVMQDFIAYKIAAIPYMIKKTEVVHFRFENFSERDPFYGESIYENNTEGKTMYGLNNSSCESVLLHLGGAGTSTTQSLGYAGSETVAVGLTPEIMRKYGLYAYTLYYELPRGIKGLSKEESDVDTMDDYDNEYELGFTVYISEKQSDGSRYMASDLYDVVVRVTDEKLDFVSLSFEDFWARRLLVSTDIDHLEKIKVEFNFDDMMGAFDFFLEHSLQTNPLNGNEVDLIRINVRPGENAYMNALVRFMIESGRMPGVPDSQGELPLQSLVSFYNRVGPKELLREGVSVVKDDYAGTYFFKQTLGIMYSTLYLETYTKAQQEEILRSAPMLARISFKLTDDIWNYVYEFYRASDRRVLVKIYQADEAGNPRPNFAPVSDFAISTSVFKKIVGAFDTILNAGQITGDEAYFPPAKKED